MLEQEKTRRPEMIVLAPPPPPGFAIGTVLQETYRIVRPLAEGGCGEVYLAAHTRLPGEFAVKVLHRSLARDREALARFRQEAEITSTLRHPHIVQVFDFNVTDGGVPYLVMELLDGVPLVDLITPGAPLDPRRTIDIIEQIAQALSAAHERGVVHRDLKPDNVMLLSINGAQDFVKVLDFGISQASWRTRLTQNEDRVSGTPQYMAPEQACGQRDQIDHRSDQFSLAAIAYTLLTGQEPFSADDPIAVLFQVVHQAPPAPAVVNPALGPAVGDAIMRGLAKESKDRFPNVIEFAAALRAAVEASAPAPVDVATASQPPAVAAVLEAAAPLPVEIEPDALPRGRETQRLIRRMRRRNRAPMRIASLVVVAGLAALAWFHPTTRTPTRAAWQQLARGAQALIDRAAPRSER